MASVEDIQVPDLGDFDEVDVVEVLVKVGQSVKAEAALIILESDKASMEIPAPKAGVVREVLVKVGDKVSSGTAIVRLEAGAEDAEASEDDSRSEASGGAATDAPAEAAKSEPSRDDAPKVEARGDADTAEEADDADEAEASPRSGMNDAPTESPTAALAVEARPAAAVPGVPAGKLPHASPAIRAFARELGVELAKVPGSGRGGRILRNDVQDFVKRSLAKAADGGLGIPPAPAVDFSKWGEIETVPLGRVRKVAAKNLHRSWLTIPHVTQHDEADVTELERFRKSEQDEAQKRGAKLTLVSFLVKASAVALKRHPRFNASLDPTGENLVLKHYVHIGVAVDTPDGLLVPVLRDCDRKGLLDIAAELGDVSKRAREKKLLPGEMQGACFSISSLGGIGGTFFTPIVNHPEVAILGASRAQRRPTYVDEQVVPRLILPLSLSYDHRVIDGAEAARFTTTLAELLGDLRLLIL